MSKSMTACFSSIAWRGRLFGRTFSPVAVVLWCANVCARFQHLIAPRLSQKSPRCTYILGQGPLTLTAQLGRISLLSSTVNWVSAFALSNTKQRWWVPVIAVYWRTYGPSRLVWSVSRQPLALFCIQQTTFSSSNRISNPLFRSISH